MKIKKKYHKSSKFLELYLTKLRISNLDPTLTAQNDLKFRVSNLKKILHLIFKYDQYRKHIWFVGISNNVKINFKNPLQHKLIYDKQNSAKSELANLKRSNTLPDLIVFFQGSGQVDDQLTKNLPKSLPVVNVVNMVGPGSITVIETLNNFLFKLINTSLVKRFNYEKKKI